MSLFCQVLASGSKGNAVLVCSSRTRILVDAGLSARELSRRMGKGPCEPAHLSGMIITHEHQDHIRGAGVMSRRFDLPVCLTRGTLENVPSQVGQLPHVQVFQPGVPFSMGDLRIHPFSTSHDARESVGFVIQNGESRLGICTDLGVATQLVKARLTGCQALVLEANHDVDMLMNGPYTWELKQRIRSRHGHLSNVDSCELLQSIHHETLKTVVFAHLSEANNHPEVVLRTSQAMLDAPCWQDVRFKIGSQSEPLNGFEIP